MGGTNNNTLKTVTKLIGGVKFSSSAEEKPQVVTDYVPPLGEGIDLLPLELFLISFSSCVGGTVAPILRRMGKTVNDLEIYAEGQRRTEHPTAFEKITLNITLISPDATVDDLHKAVSLSEERFCPVWAMIKGNVSVEVNYKVIALEA